ncbi:MAG TPA: glycosyl hydrolase family 8 [Polyangiaceae bacterium]
MPTRSAVPKLAQIAFLLALLNSCKTTLHSVGCGENSYARGATLEPLSAPSSYPNAFRDVLGKSGAEISARLDATFKQLFHGDPSTQAIYYTIGTDQAYILDVYHDDIRSEGIGLGMLIAVELGKRDEFDRLWRYAKASQYATGPRLGYFPSFCDKGSNTVACDDPFGLQQIATALLLARGRWRGAPGSIDYGWEASSLLDIIRYKQDYNCGVVDGITGTFDLESHLVYDLPSVESADTSRPSIAMPAYYELWRHATGDAFWSEAADASRNYWKASANATTGLLPSRAAFDGKPVPGSDTFVPDNYRTLIGIVLDYIWTGSQPWAVDESNRLLLFFAGQGMDTYAGGYTLDGSTVVDATHQNALIAANGALALIATVDQRTAFIDAMWNLDPSVGNPRYHSGLMIMLAQLILSGQMAVY